MQIVIMRHGEAVYGADNDASRVLTPHGERQAQSTGVQIAALLASPDAQVYGFASPFTRAQQTARLAAQHCSNLSFTTLDQLTPDTAPELALSAVEQQLHGVNAATVVFVAHMPIVARLTSLLAGEPAHTLPGFMPACAAVLEAEVLAAGCASLKHFIEADR